MISISTFTPPFQEQVIDLILTNQQHKFHVPITLNDQPDLLMIPSFYRNDNGNFWIAIHEEKVVGTIALLLFSEKQAALRKMFVAKEFRGKEFGTAQKLFDALLLWTKEKGIHEIYLGTLNHMHAAQSFYKRNGFVEMKKEELPEKYPVMHVDSMFFRKTVS